MNRVSKLFQPLLVTPVNAVVKKSDITSKSQRLMIENGLIRQAGNGTFYLLPLLQRSLEKTITIIDHYMKGIEAQKLTLPILTLADLWKQTGRLESASTELMRTFDRHEKEQLLSPTHEESITALIASVSPITYKQFPIKLYQISTKFRDEMKPRFGLMRAKEFIMKDLYTFDVCLTTANKTYEEVNEAYRKIFDHIGVPYVKVVADTGVMGGSTSHEYHYPCEVGEDRLAYCKKCSMAMNQEKFKETICQECENKNVVFQQGIEVAHTFVLEDKYSKVLGAKYLNSKGKPVNCQMGCYGIGVTRLIAASLEVLSTEKELRWPIALAPFKVCIISPKKGSKEETQAGHWSEKIYNAINYSDDVILDDRNLTIGKRMFEAKKMGYPIIVIVGQMSIRDDPHFELHLTNSNQKFELNFNNLVKEVNNLSKIIY